MKESERKGSSLEKMKTIEVPDSDVLRKLFEAFDELGFTHRFSEELGEFDVKMSGEWLTFYVDQRVLDDERVEREAFEDARRVAEYYWRQ